jgi:phosphohistidine phosphatase SixA
MWHSEDKTCSEGGNVAARRPLFIIFAIIAGVLSFNNVTHSQTLSGSSLVAVLRQGGYVIVMRHASSPRQAPDKSNANPDNTNMERQLDEAGRASSAAMGKAMRDLRIPVGEVLSSPTYRALETVRLAQWQTPKTVVELGDGGQSMQGVSEAQGMWLQKRVTQAPTGANAILVTHMPNLARAFPNVTGVADGEALIFHPDSKGNSPLVARVKIEEWPNLRP